MDISSTFTLHYSTFSDIMKNCIAICTLVMQVHQFELLSVIIVSDVVVRMASFLHVVENARCIVYIALSRTINV
ncbi:hypothetical protein J7S27_01495 [Carnobacteriaceae bacterium zg-C25]|nr:hypothetical protein J7S27_01495 [Carnobacteriaceae bacterium zg-C25]